MLEFWAENALQNIELLPVPDAGPIQCSAHRGKPKGREFEEAEIENKLDMELIKHLQNDWAPSIVFLSL